MMISAPVPVADDLRTLLRAVADPAGTQARIDAIAAAEQRLGDLTTKAEELAREREAVTALRLAHKAQMKSDNERLAAREREVSQREHELHAETEQHRRNVEAHRALVSVFESDKARHANALNELARFKAVLA